MRLILPAVPASVPQARHAAVALAEQAGAPARVVADVALAVSEACTNVVMHAYRAADAPGTLEICAHVTDDGLLQVVVTDEGGGIEERPDSPGLGMGMALMAAVTTGLELDHDGALTRVQLSFCLGTGESGGETVPEALESVADPGSTADSEPAATDRD